MLCSLAAKVSRTRLIMVIASLALWLALPGCSGDDAEPQEGGKSNGGKAVVAGQFADRAAAEFTARAQGTFIDTTVIIYCRQNIGFDEGVFKALGYTSATAPKDFELCYNVSDNLKKVALGVTSAKGGATACIVLDATSGTIARGELKNIERCLP